MKHFSFTAFAPVLLFACDLSSTPDLRTETSLSGMLTYEGEAPACDGTDVLGQFVFQLFEDPPPNPEEDAQTPTAVRIADAELVFSSDTDCGLGTASIMRSANFSLGQYGPSGILFEETSYRLVVVFDRDENYPANAFRQNPSAKDLLNRQPNRGDVFGAAYRTLESRRFRSLLLGPTSENPTQSIDDVEVTVDAVVRSEVPAFRLLPGTDPLSAEGTMPNDANVQAWEDALFAATNATLEALPATVDPWRTILDRERIEFSNAPPRGFWAREVDPLRLLSARLHPVLGILPPAFDPEGMAWRTPFVILRRARSTAEIAGRIPEVRLYPITRPSLNDKQVFSPTVELLVPPIAIVDLDPELGICQIPFIPPGNFADLYEGRPIECQELPTGDYDISVRHGVAGGIATTVSTTFSDIGIRVDGDEYIDQRWDIPNGLGTLLMDQGAQGRFHVLDPDPLTAPDPEATDAGHGIEACTLAPDRSNPPATRAVVSQTVSLACCENIRHLCGIPLCDGATGVRAATSASGGRPNCMPFLLPQVCCNS